METLEKIKDIALVYIFDGGKTNHYRIVAKSFTTVTQKGIIIEMMSASSSEVEYFFIVKNL